MVTAAYLQKTKKRAKRFILPFVKVIAKTGISPHFITLLSFLSGLLSVYFLFYNNLLFIIFSVLAVILDILDGNLARYIRKESMWGFYADQLNDRGINFLLLLRYNIAFGSLWIVLPLFLIHYFLFFALKTKSVIYVRAILVLFFIGGGFFYPAYYLGVLVSALLLALGIILQTIELINRKITKKR